jgi:aspartyl-tRNA(Asn)/glutamyl-tRNA(Gln) amidotransferase subunit B
VSFFLGDEKKTVRLVRAHLEEDAGKSLHEDSSLGASIGNGRGYSGIDLNRAGTPLLEIVTEPDMRSSVEAVAYAKELHKIVTWIGICDGNRQEGSFRCDANVSVRKPGAPLGTRREIKNLNSFKFMQQAIDYEVRWQIEQIEDGHAIQQATVLFNPDTGETRAMRTKEDAADYRYFPDPDLPPLVISPEWEQRVRNEVGELPDVMAERFVRDYAVPEQFAQAITSSKNTAKFFDIFLSELYKSLETDDRGTEAGAKGASWALVELKARCNAHGVEIHESPVSPKALSIVVFRIIQEEISHSAAKQVFDVLWSEGGEVDAIIETKGLKQINDTSALEAIIDEVLAAHPKNVEEFKAGNAKALNGLVGPIMKASKGKANPAQVNALLLKKLS